ERRVVQAVKGISSNLQSHPFRDREVFPEPEIHTPKRRPSYRADAQIARPDRIPPGSQRNQGKGAAIEIYEIVLPVWIDRISANVVRARSQSALVDDLRASRSGCENSGKLPPAEHVPYSRVHGSQLRKIVNPVGAETVRRVARRWAPIRTIVEKV